MFRLLTLISLVIPWRKLTEKAGQVLAGHGGLSIGPVSAPALVVSWWTKLKHANCFMFLSALLNCSICFYMVPMETDHMI